MLGPIDLNWVDFMRDCPLDCENGSIDPSTGAFECRQCEDTGKTEELGIDWVIAGGESGPHARVADPAWFRSLRDQCAAAGVPFLFKQWGNWDENMQHVRNKKDAGRALDGVFHEGFPS
jgi:protein gp37